MHGPERLHSDGNPAPARKDVAGPCTETPGNPPGAGNPAPRPDPPWLAGPRHVYRLVASQATACCNGAFTAAYPPFEPKPSGP